jgi:hypothetical protein
MLPTNLVRHEDCLHLGEIMELPEWRILTEAQQIFLSRYVSVGMTTGRYDAVEACKIAYKNTKYAELRAYQLLGNKRLRKIIDAHFQRSAMDSMLADLHSVIKRSLRRGSKVRGANPDLTAALAFFEKHSGQKEHSNV